jgi:Tfp pilus assembly protein PilN
MTISLLPKKKVQRPLFSLRFFKENTKVTFVWGILIALGVVFYFGSATYREALTRYSQDTASNILRVQSERDAMVEEEVRDFAGRLSTIGSLLQNHSYTSEIFAFLERVTHPAVQFKDFSFRTEGGALTMNGETQNYTTLGEQIIALEQSPNIRNLAVSNIQLDKSGRILFTIGFEIDQGLMRPNAL